MKKKKIISLLLVATMSIGLLTGCGNNVSKKDITVDPAAYIEAGLKKSFSKSPLCDIIALEDTEATSFNVSLAPSNLDEHIKFGAVIAHDELAASIYMDSALDDEEVKTEYFIDKENFALKSDEMTEVFGTNAIGVSLTDFGKNFKESAWYKTFIVESGLEEELKNDAGETVDPQAVIDLYTNLIKDVKKISEESIKYDVSEAEMEIDGETIKGYKVVQSTADDMNEKIGAAMDKFVEDLKAMLPSEASEEMTGDMTDIMDQMKAKAETSYFIAKKGGAVHEIRYKADTVMRDEWTEEDVTTTVELVVNFGSSPEDIFAPNFDLTIDEDGTKITMVGKSTIDATAKTFKVDVDANIDYPEDNEWMEDSTAKFSVVLDKDSNLKITWTADDETEEFDGKLKIDGTKVEFSFDIEEGDYTINVTTNIDFNAKKPVAFEYDDLMKWNAEKVQELMDKLGANEMYGDEYYKPEFDVDEPEFDVDEYYGEDWVDGYDYAGSDDAA